MFKELKLKINNDEETLENLGKRQQRLIAKEKKMNSNTPNKYGLPKGFVNWFLSDNKKN